MAQLLVLNLLAFIAALSFGFTVTSMVTHFRKRSDLKQRAPEDNMLLRISAGNAVYRTRFLGATAEGWAFAAPLQRSTYVPIRLDQSLVVEFGEGSQRHVFRSRLVSRDSTTGTMVMSCPEKIYDLQGERSTPDLHSFEGLPYLS